MLAGLRRRAARAGLEGRIDLRLARPERLGIDDLAGRTDLVLAFYVVHELREPAAFFAEVAAALKPGGAVLVVERRCTSRARRSRGPSRSRRAPACAWRRGRGSVPARRPC